MRQLYERGDNIVIISVDDRLAKLGFKEGQRFKVWVDYEDLIYLDSPIKTQTSEDYLYPHQIRLGL